MKPGILAVFQYLLLVVLVGPALGALVGIPVAAAVFSCSGPPIEPSQIISILLLGALYGVPIGGTLGMLVALIFGWHLRAVALGSIVYYLYLYTLSFGFLGVGAIFVLGFANVPFGGFFPIITTVVGLGWGLFALECHREGNSVGTVCAGEEAGMDKAEGH